MPISDLPLLSMIRTRMHWQQERQKVLAENVANADTPGFKPRDLTEPNFDRAGPAAPRLGVLRTDPGHLVGFGVTGADFDPRDVGGYESRPMGNAVSLEDEMLKVAQNQMDYQTVTSLYTRSLGLVKIALGKK